MEKDLTGNHRPYIFVDGEQRVVVGSADIIGIHKVEKQPMLSQLWQLTIEKTHLEWSEPIRLVKSK